MAVIFFAIAFLASIAGAITGVGGGIIIKPVIDATNLLQPAQVNFLSGNAVLAMTIVSLAQNFIKKGEKIDWSRSLFLSIGAAAGGLIGGQAFKSILRLFPNALIVKLIQSVILLLMTVSVLIYVRNKHRIRSKDINNPIISTLLGTILGFISAFLGIGGGPLNIAFLYYFFSMGPKKAAINSLLVIFFSQIFNLGNSIVRNSVPAFDPWNLALMAIGAVAGAMIGRATSSRIRESQVDKFFQSFLLLISLINVYNIVTTVVSLT